MTMLFDDTIYTRTTDPDTSRIAASLMGAPARADLKSHILAILTVPTVDDDLIQLYIAGGGTRTPQRVRTARAELVREGKVREAGWGRSYAGNPSERWEVVK